jgi:hypothetical protein
MANNRYITGDIEGVPAPKKKVNAPLVQAVEPIKGDWSQNNNWGASFEQFKNGWPLVNNPSIFAVAQCPSFRGPPRVRGILLTNDVIYLGAATTGPSVQARITYGSGGVSNIVVEAIVTGTNDNGFGGLLAGAILSVNFSNELIPKVGYTTLTVTWNTAIPLEVPPFATGFIIGDRGVALPTDTIFGSSPEGVTIYSLYEPFANGNVGLVNWLPNQVVSLNSGAGAVLSISWVLSV